MIYNGRSLTRAASPQWCVQPLPAGVKRLVNDRTPSVSFEAEELARAREAPTLGTQESEKDDRAVIMKMVACAELKAADALKAAEEASIAADFAKLAYQAEKEKEKPNFLSDDDEDKVL